MWQRILTQRLSRTLPQFCVIAANRIPHFASNSESCSDCDVVSTSSYCQAPLLASA
ncbi:hypothetical protein M378DRAFT_165797 [Amanita muscaria Koide BX008]|uniref:Uncharacterized protein n=1 Tax=Amanita muscaria (strain Koide BX008) TaxID=946122 RepID=A0A0C2SH30_AMAMK|nr:hypothetical protein M378DRAFT_165797 [Amanita muscaria Koide BX008]